jgi:hypothetical protein
MSPANLALRFFLEIAALGGFSILAWRLADGPWRYLAVIAVLALLMTLWGVFAVPGDPSRSGNAPVPVPGGLRLLLEFAILLGGAWASHAAGYSWAGLSLAGLVGVHYLLWTDRIAWLLQN